MSLKQESRVVLMVLAKEPHGEPLGSDHGESDDDGFLLYILSGISH